MKTKIIILVVLMLFPVLARAEGHDEKYALAEQYMGVIFTDDPSGYVIGMMDKMLEAQSLGEEALALIHEALAMMDWDMLFERYKELLVEGLSHEELSQLVEFSSSELGVSMIAKQEEIIGIVGSVLQEMMALMFSAQPLSVDLSGVDPKKMDLANQLVDLVITDDIRQYTQRIIMQSARDDGAAMVHLIVLMKIISSIDSEGCVRASAARIAQVYTIEELEALVEYSAKPGTRELNQKLVAVSMSFQSDLRVEFERAFKEFLTEGGLGG